MIKKWRGGSDARETTLNLFCRESGDQSCYGRRNWTKTSSDVNVNLCSLWMLYLHQSRLQKLYNIGLSSELWQSRLIEVQLPQALTLTNLSWSNHCVRISTRHCSQDKTKWESSVCFYVLHHLHLLIHSRTVRERENNTNTEWVSGWVRRHIQCINKARGDNCGLRVCVCVWERVKINQLSDKSGEK